MSINTPESSKSIIFLFWNWLYIANRKRLNRFADILV